MAREARNLFATLILPLRLALPRLLCRLQRLALPRARAVFPRTAALLAVV